VDERRETTRYRAVELQAELLLDDGSQQIHAEDISKGGICFIYKAPLPLGDQRSVRLILELGPDQFSEPLDLAVRIIWSTPIDDSFQIGAAFNEMKPAAAQELETLIYLLTRDVKDDPNGRLRFRTGLHQIVD